MLMTFGGQTLKDFAFAMVVGIASGTYSSIFIASPVLTAWKEREPGYRRRRERIEEQMGYVPAFPEDNVIARVEGEPEPAAPPERPAPAPSRADVRAPSPPEPPAPGAAPEAPSAAPATEAPEPAPDRAGGDGAPDGAEAARERELSEASAAALRRAREQRKSGRKRRKHGRPR
jgi:SecD/SecF fusion protein